MNGHLLSASPFFETVNKAIGFGTDWIFWEADVVSIPLLGIGGLYPFGFTRAGLARIFYHWKTLTVASTVTGSMTGATALEAMTGFQATATVRAHLLAGRFRHYLTDTIAGQPASFEVEPNGYFHDGLFYPKIRYRSNWLFEGENGGVVDSVGVAEDAIGDFVFLGEEGTLYGDVDAEHPPSGDVTITGGTAW